MGGSQRLAFAIVLSISTVCGALVASAQTVDDATAREAIATVEAIDRAAQAGDVATLRRRARFPLPVSWVEYDMEVHVRRGRVATAEALAHRWQGDFAVPHEFLAAAGQGAARTGGPICDDDAMNFTDADTTPLWRRGDPAVARTARGALSVTFVRERCGVTQGYAVWTLAHTPAGWQLVAIRARTTD